ncbi:DksA/TraR family C4-type zinc finger protein [Amphritea pacifica]|uniref:DksA/TraR family C4-type zinc finger protein n=1 Tax=Amphritea pacifica TaxID=2811233 RepID=A0ABS2W7G0_9GAMM|nr:DksA/TraR family C4-type zinc finger protein [Amphritea pacifica]MBN0987337.1 DksA/TraR family C4-type zinc finger protein [Amphritea pacifica]MBN1006104.1 DksA/TraR family C4-type zinc finger protein [Amphritea pacifica]
MAGGWARDGAVQDQIDASVEDAVALARSRLNTGSSAAESLTHCEECDQPIPEKRRQAVPGIRLCIKCQAELEKQQVSSAGINRRGSKDSQLR